MSAVEVSFQNAVGVVALSRPEAANSFNADVIQDIKAAVSRVEGEKGCRAILLKGRGKHFSAGADLAWMKASASLSRKENEREAQSLASMFDKLSQSLPSLAVVHGAAFGGAVGLTAACDVAIAADTARFCLSEVRVGLFPAVILPFLMKKMDQGALRRFALSGRVFSAQEALDAGLVQKVVPEADLDAAAREELNGFLAGAPGAQKSLKELMHQLQLQNLSAPELTASYIAEARVGAEAQGGLSAFFEKKAAPWTAALPEGFKA